MGKHKNYPLLLYLPCNLILAYLKGTMYDTKAWLASLPVTDIRYMSIVRFIFALFAIRGTKNRWFNTLTLDTRRDTLKSQGHFH